MQAVGRGRPTAVLHTSIVFVAALAVRYLFVCELRDHAYLGNIRVSDAQTYFTVAHQIVAGTLPFEPYWQAPLYPLLLALFQSVFGDALHTVQWLHIVIGALNCVLLFRLSDTLFGPRAAKASAFVAVFYAPFLLFDVQPLPANLTMLLDLLLLSSYLRYRAGGGAGWLASAGLLFGAAVVTHGLALFTLPVFVHDLVSRRNENGGKKKIGEHLALFMAMAMLAPAAASIRNSIAAGTPVFVSYNAGINLYIGNHHDLEQTLGRRGGWEWEELFRDPHRSGAKAPAAMNRHFVGRALEQWLESPGALLATWTQKFLLSMGGSEPKRNFPIYPLRESSWILTALLWEVEVSGVVLFAFPAGLVIPLAALGFLMLRRGTIGGRLGVADMSLAGWVAVFHLLGMLVFFPTARYRVPALILLLPYAGAMAIRIGDQLRSVITGDTSVHVRGSAIAVVLLFVLVNPVASNVFRHPVKDRAEHLYFSALWAREKLHTTKSLSLDASMVAQITEAMRIDPAYPEPVGFMAAYYLQRDIDRSLEFLAQLNALVPENNSILEMGRAAIAIRDERSRQKSTEAREP